MSNYKIEAAISLTTWDRLTAWFETFGLQVLVVVVFVFLIQYLLGHFIKQAIGNALKHSSAKDSKRKQTITKTVIRVIQTLVWIIGVMIVVDVAGYNVAPLLTGAGVGGIVIGFGAQSLIRDLISGMFIIAENQYRIGDIVELNGVSGRVEDINLRTTVLRDLDGFQHHIPNGTIELSTNKTMSYSRVNIDLTIGYNSNIDKVEKIINKIGQELSDDTENGKKYIEPITFTRVKSFGESAISIKVLGKVKPGYQWQASGDFHREIKKAFEKHRIEIPFPQRVIHTSK